MTGLIPDPSDAVRQLTELAEAGVERVMLQHLNHTDLDMLQLVAEEVAPQLR
jgi:phosphoribosyl 1,2-cyclic phosphodiesterase